MRTALQVFNVLFVFSALLSIGTAGDENRQETNPSDDWSFRIKDFHLPFYDAHDRLQWEVKARYGVSTSDDIHRAEGLELRIYMGGRNGEENVILKADKGVIDRRGKKARLEGKVEVQTSAGRRARTEMLTSDLESKTVATDSRISIKTAEFVASGSGLSGNFDLREFTLHRDVELKLRVAGSAINLSEESHGESSTSIRCAGPMLVKQVQSNGKAIINLQFENSVRMSAGREEHPPIGTEPLEYTTLECERLEMSFESVKSTINHTSPEETDESISLIPTHTRAQGSVVFSELREGVPVISGGARTLTILEFTKLSSNREDGVFVPSSIELEGEPHITFEGITPLGAIGREPGGETEAPAARNRVIVKCSEKATIKTVDFERGIRRIEFTGDAILDDGSSSTRADRIWFELLNDTPRHQDGYSGSYDSLQESKISRVHAEGNFFSQQRGKTITAHSFEWDGTNRKVTFIGRPIVSVTNQTKDITAGKITIYPDEELIICSGPKEIRAYRQDDEKRVLSLRAMCAGDMKIEKGSITLADAVIVSMPGIEISCAEMKVIIDEDTKEVEILEAEGMVQFKSERFSGAGDRLKWTASDETIFLEGHPFTKLLMGDDGKIVARTIKVVDKGKHFSAGGEGGVYVEFATTPEQVDKGRWATDLIE